MNDELDTLDEPVDTKENPLAVVKSIKDVLLVIFIHGFKGTDETFANFPERLQHILAETIPNTVVECTVFPAYEVGVNRPMLSLAIG